MTPAIATKGTGELPSKAFMRWAAKNKTRIKMSRGIKSEPAITAKGSLITFTTHRLMPFSFENAHGVNLGHTYNMPKGLYNLL